MLSLRCVRWVGWLFCCRSLVACSNGTGSRGRAAAAARPAQGAQDSFTVGGNVSGLVGSGLVLQNNGGGDLPVAADGAFTFATRLATGTAYNVAVLSQPTSPVADLHRNPRQRQHRERERRRRRGDVRDRAVLDPRHCLRAHRCGPGAAEQRRQRSADLRQRSRSPSPIGWSMARPIRSPCARSRADRTASCAIPPGTIRGADVSNVEVACASNRFTIGGRVTGLAGSGLVRAAQSRQRLVDRQQRCLRIRDGAAERRGVRSVGAHGSRPIRRRSARSATAAGTVAGGNVTNIAINCVSSSFTVGGTVSGLAGSGLVLQLNGDGDLPIASDGSFTFGTPVPSGSQYRVQSRDSAGESDAGVHGRRRRRHDRQHQRDQRARHLRVEHVLDRRHGRRPAWARGLVLQNNGGDDLAVSADGLFTFPVRAGERARRTTSPCERSRPIRTRRAP